MIRRSMSARMEAGWYQARSRRICSPRSLASISGRTATYATVAGLALSVFKRLPKVGDKFEHGDWTFEIMDMDGRKIDKLLVSRKEN